MVGLGSGDPAITIAAPTDYAELPGKIQAQGLMERRSLYYAVKISVLLASFVAVWCGFFLLGESWLQLAVAAGFGIVLAQLGFLGHDAAHQPRD